MEEISFVLGPVSLGESHIWAMVVVAVLVILDILSGICASAKEGILSSAKMREGLWHKAGYVLIIALALIIEIASGHLDLGFNVPLLVPACIYICLNEVMSVSENAVRLYPNLAGSKLLKIFESVKEETAIGEGKPETEAKAE